MLSNNDRYILNNGGGIQWTLLITISAIVFFIGSAYLVFTGSIANAETYYVYFGSTGPYSVTENIVDGVKIQHNGNPTNKFKAGEWVGWNNDLTVEAGVGVQSTITLYNLQEKKTAWLQEGRINNNERRSGPKDFFFQLPTNVEPGNYELRRKSIFYPKNNTPVSQEFSPIPLEVIK